MGNRIGLVDVFLEKIIVRTTLAELAKREVM